jgi:nitronate monooxygenase
MWRDTRFTSVTGARLPIIAAPMAGGPTTPALVAAVCEAGGFGVLDGGYRSPDDFRTAIREVRRLTSAPFGVNLFVPQPYVVDDDAVDAALALLTPYADELDVSLDRPAVYAEDAEAQYDIVLEEAVPFFSFTFGIPASDRLGAMRAAGIVTCGTATTVAEARALVEADVDLVCVQGGEAGGHRGGFLDDDGATSAVSLVALVPLVRDAVDIPVIAAGGLMDGRGIAAALTLGADAAQLGTAFLLCPEAGTSAPYRKAVAAAKESDTTLTKAFSGRPARGLRNRMSDDLAGVQLPPYPVMNALTRPLRRAAAEAGRSEFLSLWAGHGVPLSRELPAAQLVAALEDETERAINASRGQ